MPVKRRTDDESLKARFNGATDQMRRSTLSKANVNEPGYEDFAPLSYWRERWTDLKVQQRFIEKFLKIRDAFDENTLVPFRFTDVQSVIHHNSSSRTVIAKGRGVMSTRYWLAKKFADCVVLSGRALRIVPQDPDTEDELFADLKVFYENLPDHLRPATRYYSKELIHFHDPEKGVLDSRITTLSVPPGYEGKGRGLTVTDLLMTETPFWRCDQRKAFTSLMGAVRKGNAVSESTADGLELHYQLYTEAKQGKNGWTPLFFGWWWNRNYRIDGAWLGLGETITLNWESARGKQCESLTKHETKLAKAIFRHLRKFGYVGKGTDWQCNEVAACLAWRRDKIAELGPRKFKVDYPENDRECFEQSGRPLVSAEFLKVTCRAISEPVPGRAYGIGADTSLGLESGDPAAIQIIDLTNGKQVYEEESKLAPDLLAYRLADLSDEWNGATIVVERNNTGIATINKLIELGYEDRLYKYLDAKTRRAIDDGRKDFYDAVEEAQYGFLTNAETKGLLGVALEQGIRTGALGLSSERFCEQCKTVAWKDNKSWEAQSGYHDDLVIALAIVYFALMYEAGIGRGFVGALPEFGQVG